MTRQAIHTFWRMPLVLVAPDSVIPEKKIWNVSEQNLETFDNNKIFENKKELINMLKVFYQYGYVIIENTKAEENEVINFAEKLGPVRATNFGKFFI